MPQAHVNREPERGEHLDSFANCDYRSDLSCASGYGSDLGTLTLLVASRCEYHFFTIKPMLQAHVNREPERGEHLDSFASRDYRSDLSCASGYGSDLGTLTLHFYLEITFRKASFFETYLMHTLSI